MAIPCSGKEWSNSPAEILSSALCRYRSNLLILKEISIGIYLWAGSITDLSARRGSSALSDMTHQ